jgi:Domain of unknown function (DUF1707)
MSTRREMRVSDQERQAAVDRLKAAHDEGRLDFHEYDLRIATAYGARTYGDLDELFADLPLDPPAPIVAATSRPAVPPPSPRPVPPTPAQVDEAAAGLPTALKVLWIIWGSVVTINLTVWLLVSLGNGGVTYFWPMWLLVPGSVLFAVSGAVTVARGRRLPPGRG